MFGRSTNANNTDLEFFTVFDSKAKVYSEPFPGKNSEVVLRDFVNAFRNPEAAQKNRYYMNAEDFSIFKIGKFDTQTGKLQVQELEHVANLHDIRAMSKPVEGLGALLPT